MKNIRNALWGLVFIVIGVIIALNVLGITQIEIFFDGWWTLFIIIPCFIGLFKSGDKVGNIIGLLIGAILLLSCQNIIDASKVWDLLLPAVLVIIGVFLIFGDFFRKKTTEIAKKLYEKREKDSDCCMIFASRNVNYDAVEFKGSELNAIFGGIKYDLRNAVINSDVVINVSAVFGRVDIFLPDSVNVKVSSTCLFGGVENKNKAAHVDGVPTVYIQATSIFGGVKIV